MLDIFILLSVDLSHCLIYLNYYNNNEKAYLTQIQ